MRAAVYNNGVLVGYLKKYPDGKYVFSYLDEYYSDKEKPPVSLTLPKTQREHYSDQLFSFFYGLLSEGINKEIQCSMLKIDEEDSFTRLLQTAGHDTIGAITIQPAEDVL